MQIYLLLRQGVKRLSSFYNKQYLHRLLLYNNEACFAETFKIKTHKNGLFVDSIHQ